MSNVYDVHVLSPYWSMLSETKQRILKKKLNPNRPKDEVQDDLEELHKLAFCNQKAISGSGELACFFCLKFWRHNERPIEAWIDPWIDRTSGPTALCPWCGIDAVLPCYGQQFSMELLKAMHLYWFRS